MFHILKVLKIDICASIVHLKWRRLYVMGGSLSHDDTRGLA